MLAHLAASSEDPVSDILPGLDNNYLLSFSSHLLDITRQVYNLFQNCGITPFGFQNTIGLQTAEKNHSQFANVHAIGKKKELIIVFVKV